MSILIDALTSAFKDDLQIDRRQGPSSLICCIVPVEKFAEAAWILRKKKHALLAAEWAADESPFGRGFGIFACYRWGKEYLIVRSDLPADNPEFPSLTRRYLPAYRFERQIQSLMGVIPAGHPDARPWIKFEDWPEDAWPLRKSFEASEKMPRLAGEYKFVGAEGEGVYEIPVGPVHAGIIEPGHFRFQAVGEDIINLEERLGYVHKGIEKRFESLSWQDGSRLAGRVSGDTTVGHSLAYCMALESMTGSSIPQRAQWLRALFLERERIANHLGDLGAICNDAAFSLMFYQMMRLKEIVLRTNDKVFRHRFMMDRIIPGGVAVDIDPAGKDLVLAELNMLLKEFNRLVTIYDENSSLEDRVRDTGILVPEKAREICAVGFVARASGLNLDCRTQNPFPPYDRIKVNVPVLISGDVHARAWVRVEEVRESVRIIRRILETLPAGDIAAALVSPAPDTSGFSAVEGWRGEIVYWLQAGPKGEVNRCMVRDPSGVNWLGLEQAVLGNIVPDFPLCNKSFNQSYSGHDL
ncbi:MAG: NADH-quinone oxidoreductase subunit C [Nitrospirae bacterium]|nr:NADH-quinone oxidoreductase subunit C [Nitrospirota bacterium]